MEQTEAPRTELAPLPRPGEIRHDGETPIAPWLKRVDAPAEGTEDAGQFRPRARIKIVQKTTKSEELIALVGEGGICVVPEQIAVATLEEEFVAIPLFFGPTWEKWSDYNDRNSDTVLGSVNKHTSVLEWTTQKDRSGRDVRVPLTRHEFFVKARNPSLRSEQYGEDPKTKKPWFYSYVEALNFAILIDSGPAAGEMAVLTFMRGGWRTGSNLSKRISDAGRKGWPIYQNRFAFRAELTKQKQTGEPYYHIVFNNPSDAQKHPEDVYGEGGPRFICPKMEGDQVVDWGRIMRLSAMHAELKAMYDADQFAVFREDEGSGGGGGNDDHEGDPEIPI